MHLFSDFPCEVDRDESCRKQSCRQIPPIFSSEKGTIGLLSSGPHPDPAVYYLSRSLYLCSEIAVALDREMLAHEWIHVAVQLQSLTYGFTVESPFSVAPKSENRIASITV